MKKYIVTLIKKEIFEVEAENEDQAIENACELCNEDVMSFFDPVDEFEVEEIKNE